MVSCLRAQIREGRCAGENETEMKIDGEECKICCGILLQHTRVYTAVYFWLIFNWCSSSCHPSSPLYGHEVRGSRVSDFISTRFLRSPSLFCQSRHSRIRLLHLSKRSSQLRLRVTRANLTRGQHGSSGTGLIGGIFPARKISPGRVCNGVRTPAQKHGLMFSQSIGLNS